MPITLKTNDINSSGNITIFFACNSKFKNDQQIFKYQKRNSQQAMLSTIETKELITASSFVQEKIKSLPANTKEILLKIYQ